MQLNRVRALLAAFGYFSIVPVGRAARLDPEALAWLPFVGAVLGAFAGLSAWGVARAGNSVLAVVVAFGLTIILTGAIHVDGFLDGCDAFFARVSVQRRIEILDDPCHGTFAIAGFAVVAAVWLAALRSIPPAHYPFALALAAASSRWGAVVHASDAPYCGGSHAAAFKRRPPIAILGAELALIAALVWPLARPGVVAAIAALVIATASLWWARQKLGGGVTGDAFGFAIVLAETSALTALAW